MRNGFRIECDGLDENMVVNEMSELNKKSVFLK